MIAYFPAPHPDELFYSVCARYGDRAQYWNKGSISLELFGARGSTATIDLPSRLEYFADSLPKGHSLLVDRLIDEHTLLPFYSPFLEKNRVERIRHEMKGTGGGAVHNIAAITPSKIRPPDFLKFCPACVEADRREYRECYWHRLHQVPGILVCSKHKSILEDSEVRARNRINGYAYISAEQAKLHADVRHVNMADDSHRCLMFISQSAEWLLKQRGLVPGYESLRIYYMEGFNAKGLSYAERFVHASKLPAALRHTYPQSMLSAIQCDFDDDKEYSWPYLLVKELRLRKANHPLRHLLFIGLIGLSLESFFRICSANEIDNEFILPKQISTYKNLTSRKAQKAKLPQGANSTFKPKISCPPGALRRSKIPFGIGPWPCLNIVCRFYYQPVIIRCKVAKHWEDRNIVVGFFSCACGFTYRRSGPDNSLKDQLRFHSIKAYGEVWVEQLRKLWDDLSLSIHKIGPMLGVGHNTADYQARLLGLKFPRHGPGSKIAHGRAKKYKNKQNRKRIKRLPPPKRSPKSKYRKELLQVIKSNPNANRSTLEKRLVRPAYTWLQKHDRNWLEAHLPTPIKRVGSNRRVDWSIRDAQLAEDVRRLANQIRTSEGHPVRVTPARIGRELDKAALLNNRKFYTKIPLTAQVLSEVIETQLAFNIRCVRWATDCYRREDIVPSIAALAKRAGMTMTTTYKPEVRVIINQELESLRSRCDLLESKVA